MGMGSGLYFCGVKGCQTAFLSLSANEFFIKGSKLRVNARIEKQGCVQRNSLSKCQDSIRVMDYNRLVKDCLRGLPEAQKQLYEHFAESMLGICYRYTKSVVDAEDVL